MFDPLFENSNSNDKQNKHIWIKKATGIGATEFYLRLMAWLCLRDDALQNTIMVIVTGPRIDMTNDLIARFKHLFFDFFMFTDAKDRAVLNKVDIRAYPSNHTETIRSIPNVSFVLMDEADFFEKSEQMEVIDSVERYIGKSDPYIVMISTPNNPEGLFAKIEVLPERECIYRRFQLGYTVGLPSKDDPDNVYTIEEMERAKSSWSFDREYGLKYLGHVGNIFHMNDIDYAVNVLGNQYNPHTDDNTDPMITRSMGVDPGFGSSMFGIVIQQFMNGLTEVIYADHIQRGSMTECLDAVLRLVQKHRIMKVYVDASAAGFIADLKKAYGENRHYAEMIKNNPHIVDVWITQQDPKVVPISFKERHETMLRDLEQFLQKKLVRIHPSFDKLIIALRTASSKGDKYDLDKEKTSHDDILDAMQLSMLYLRLKP